MQSRAKNFLSKEEQQKITKTVQEMEKQTSGEIVPMIVAQSDDYPQAASNAAAIISLPLAIVLTHVLGSFFWIGSQNMWLFLILLIVLFFAIRQGVQYTDFLRLPFLSRKRIEQEVHKCALAAFYSEKLFKTKASNGILLFISVLERKVIILADSGINECIDQTQWNDIVAKLSTEIKENRRCDAICDAIREIGKMLSSHFPFQKDDVDELHNLIIR